MSTTRRNMFNTTGLLVLAALFLGVIMVSNMTLRGLRWDLTENSLYTISEGSKNILATIDDPINLYFYYSDRASEDAPGLRNYAVRVREMLEEFSLHAGGKINLQVIDPLPFSEDEDRAAQFGLQNIPIGVGNEQFYLGLAGTNAVDDVEIIPFFQPNKETFLEYDISKLIHGLTVTKRTVVGLMTTLPMNMQLDPATQQPRPAWAINGQIGQLFELRTVDTTTTSIDEDVDILMLAHPQNLEDRTLYTIDQFVMRGGKALIFVDPHSAFSSPQPGMPPQGPPGSNLPKLFGAWGIEVSAQVVTDARHALQVNAGGNRGAVRHPGILGLGRGNFNSDDVITAQLSSMNIATAGFITKKTDAAIELTPLMTSSTEAMPTPAERFLMMQDPSTLLDGFKATGENYVIAARARGEVDSAFPDGAPTAAEVKEGEDQQAADEKTEDNEPKDPPSEHLAKSNGPVNLIVVADTDMLGDQFWVRTQNFFGQRLSTAFANNGDFVINALDSLTGSDDLISIRSRAAYSRPFETVQELERSADARFRAKEQELQRQLGETERKLGELQAKREDDSSALLTAEQQQEIQRFNEERLRIRKDLRQVRRNLDRDIERLGATLRVANIGLVPLLLTVFTLVFVFLRKRARRK